MGNRHAERAMLGREGYIDGATVGRHGCQEPGVRRKGTELTTEPCKGEGGEVDGSEDKGQGGRGWPWISGGREEYK